MIKALLDKSDVKVLPVKVMLKSFRIRGMLKICGNEYC